MDDTTIMKKVFALAKKGEGSVRSNPLVGCIVLGKTGILSQGYHTVVGGPHAEVIALEKAGLKAKGATLYVNLEPCCHFGKTGPCTQRIIAAGIKKVVIAMHDPNPKVSGKGILELKKAGITVIEGVLEAQAQKLNERFITFITTRLPFVHMKVACSLDGKLAAQDGSSQWISNPRARDSVHRMRNAYDAILVGIGTVLVDNPTLTCRLPNKKKGKNPLRIIVDSKLRIPLDAKVLADNNVLIATSSKHDCKKASILQKKGVRILVSSGDQVNLSKLLSFLGKSGISSVLVEGGQAVVTAFLKERLASKISVFIAPKIIGGTKCFVQDLSITSIEECIALKNPEIEVLSDNVCITGYLKNNALNNAR